jgi:hypothetical protein
MKNFGIFGGINRKNFGIFGGNERKNFGKLKKKTIFATKTKYEK